jgi:hypothetical protein
MASLASNRSANEEALWRARDRAGDAFACMFSSSDEFEADIIAKRRAAGAYRKAGGRGWLRFGATVTMLAAVFLML